MKYEFEISNEFSFLSPFIFISFSFSFHFFLILFSFLFILFSFLSHFFSFLFIFFSFFFVFIFISIELTFNFLFLFIPTELSFNINFHSPKEIVQHSHSGPPNLHPQRRDRRGVAVVEVEEVVPCGRERRPRRAKVPPPRGPATEQEKK